MIDVELPLESVYLVEVNIRASLVHFIQSYLMRAFLSDVSESPQCLRRHSNRVRQCPLSSTWDTRDDLANFP